MLEAAIDRLGRTVGGIGGAAIEVHGLDADASDPKSETVRGLATSDAENPRVRISLRFQTEPVEIVGAERVEGLRVSDASGRQVIPAQTIVTAIGFTGESVLVADPRVHTVGWVRRGPVGTIPDNRTDARQVADAVLASLPARASARDGFGGLPQTVQERAVGIDHWRQIDAREIAGAGEGRARRKIRTWAGLLEGHHEPVLSAPGSHDTDFHDSKGTDR